MVRTRSARVVVGLGALVAVGLAWVLLGPGGPLRDVLVGPPAPEEVPVAEHDPVDLVGEGLPGPSPDAAPVDADRPAPSPATEPEVGTRTGAAPAEEGPETLPLVRVHGRVLDELGRAVPGTRVDLVTPVDLGSDPAAEARPATDGPGGVNTRTRISTLEDEELIRLLQEGTVDAIDFVPSQGGPFVSTDRIGWELQAETLTLVGRTDDDGRFDFGECSAVEGMRLRYGHELYLGRPPEAEVLLDGLEQVLRLPQPPGGGVVLDVVLRDRAGGPPQPVEVLHARLIGVGQQSGPARREPLPHQVLPRPAGAEVRGLAAGRWRVWARGAHTSLGSGEILLPVDPEVSRVTLELEVAVLPAGPYLEDDLAQLAQGEARPDEANGFAEYDVAGQTPRGFGDRRTDGYFRHTFRGFGTGEVAGAWLELELTAHSGMSHNDGVHLEYRGRDVGGFVWNHPIQGLPGVHGRWSSGERAWVQLDLSRLPTKDGPLDLLPYLEDGRLDLMVSDDTCVESAHLRVKP